MRRVLLAVLLLAVPVRSVRLQADLQAQQQIRVLKVRGDVSMIQTTGGNVTGQVGTDGAEIIAHENVLDRLSAKNARPPVPARAWPQTTYHTDSIKLSTLYHGDGVQLFYAPAAHTDGDSIVYFRHNDVIATGDVFSTVT